MGTAASKRLEIQPMPNKNGRTFTFMHLRPTGSEALLIHDTTVILASSLQQLSMPQASRHINLELEDTTEIEHRSTLSGDRFPLPFLRRLIFISRHLWSTYTEIKHNVVGGTRAYQLGLASWHPPRLSWSSRSYRHKWPNRA